MKLEKYWSYRLLRDQKDPRRSQRGVALMLAVLTMVLITYLVTEITYDTQIEYSVNSGAISRLKAYYAAKSSMQLALLRIKIYSQATQQYKTFLKGGQAKVLDLIWSFPFMWPPTLPESTTRVDKEAINDALKKSTMDANYTMMISDEGSKIDINDLGSPVKALRDSTQKLLLGIFESRMKNDEDWARDNRDLDYARVINNIIDWVDADDTSLNGGGEKELYGDLGTDKLPPNRGFRTVEELRLVAGMNEAIFNMLKDRVTVYGSKAINVNHASSEVLQALHPSITAEIAQKLIARRDDEKLGGPYKGDAQGCANDFWSYASSQGAQVDQATQQSLAVSCDSVINFRIKALGEYHGATREIEAVVLDVNQVASTLAAELKKQQPQDPNAPITTSTAQPPGVPGPVTNQLPKGPPRIVYWTER